MGKIVYLFSGQGSQYPGMGKELCDAYPAAKRVFECAGDIMGFDVARLAFYGTPEEMSGTDMAQPLIYAMSLACLEAVRTIRPELPFGVAGHSLGEFAALTCGGAFSMEDGFSIVKARGKLMQEGALASKGAMYAILGSDEAMIEASCAAAGGLVIPVNFNTPSQTVISGEQAAVEAAAEALSQKGAKAVRLGVAGAFHTALMTDAAERLKESLSGIAFSQPQVAFYSNLTGGLMDDIPSYPEYFRQHMVSPVRFVEQVGAMAKDGADVFIELGPKKTLCQFIKKIDKELVSANAEDVKSLDKAATLLR